MKKIFIFLFLALNFAGGPDELEEARNALEGIKMIYSESAFIEMSLQKKLFISTLGKTKKYGGKLYMAGGNQFRLEIEEPEKSLMVMNNKKAFVVDYPLEGFDDKLRVSIFEGPNIKKSQELFRLLMGDGDIYKLFHLKSAKRDEKKWDFVFSSKSKDFDLTQVMVTVDLSQDRISSLSYFDQLENKVTYDFSKIKFSQKVNKKLFKYESPKDAEITKF